jgi:hypothetical protein
VHPHCRRPQTEDEISKLTIPVGLSDIELIQYIIKNGQAQQLTVLHNNFDKWLYDCDDIDDAITKILPHLRV